MIAPGPAARDLAGDVDLVLDRDRHAEQRRVLAGAAAAVGGVGLGERALGVHGAERVELADRSAAIRRSASSTSSRADDLAAPHEVGLRRDTGEGDVHVEHPGDRP